MEAAAEALDLSARYVVLAVETNDAGRHMIMEHAERHFTALLGVTGKHFPNTKVRERVSYLAGSC